ncbi:MAG: DUF5723 family protein [Cryomorphaceae bacterium]|nr:DUF5723 family protein [Cryomorphaceae bacterium]
MSKTFIFAFAVLVLLSSTLIAQQNDLLLYNYKDVAQSSLLNPATRTSQRVSVGLFHLGAMTHSSAFSAYDIMGKGTVFNDNIENILGNFGGNEFIRGGASSNVMFTSFNLSSKWQISFGGMINQYNHIQIPENLIRLITRGNAQFENQVVQFGGWSMETSLLASIHLGASYVVNDKLTIGARLYRHQGIYNFNVRQNDNNLQIEFKDDVWITKSDFYARSSFVGGPMFDEDGAIFDYSADEALSNYSSNQNIGYSLDLGAEYTINDKLSVSASLLGLGAVNYTANNVDVSSNASWDYDGIRYDVRNDAVFAGEFLDTLNVVYGLDYEKGSSYRRSLPTQLYLGATYDLSKMHQFHGVARYTNWLNSHHVDVNFRYVIRPAKFFSAMASITTVQGKVFGGGGGFQLYFPGIQFFMIADVATNNISISHFRGAMVQTGINVALWDRSERRQRKKKDDVNETELSTGL